MAPPATSSDVTPFTLRDVTLHTLTVWATFMVLSLAYGCIRYPDTFRDTGALPLLGATVVAYAVIALALTWLGAPFAWLLGWALRSVRRRWVHVVAFGLLGFVAGGVASVVAAAAAAGAPIADPILLLALFFAAVCGGCTAFARWVAFRLRHRRRAMSERTGVSVGRSRRLITISSREARSTRDWAPCDDSLLRSRQPQ